MKFDFDFVSKRYIILNLVSFSKYFRKHRFIGVYEYHQPKLMILDPQLASDIYVKYFKNFGVNTIGGERVK